MGQAKRRGTFEQRKQQAIERNEKFKLLMNHAAEQPKQQVKVTAKELILNWALAQYGVL